MKYIRTKDGIYEIDETTILMSLPPCYKVIKPTDKYYAINKQQVIKSADTIEELCDEFVGILNGRHIKSLSKDLYILKPCEDIYGAIWTDKGLIYVAKMNDKGELELL